MLFETIIMNITFQVLRKLQLSQRAGEQIKQS